MQGNDNLVVEQTLHTDQLLEDLKSAVNITGSLSSLDMLTVVSDDNIAAHISNHIGTFTVKYISVVQILEAALMRTANDLEELNEQERREIEVTVANSFYHLFQTYTI